MDVQSVRANGICHGLPDLDANITGLRAIVVGASGMSGQQMIDVLAQSPQRWEKIYALSRRPPQPSKTSHGVNVIKHVPTDLLKESQEIAEGLKEHDVQA